MMHVTFIKRIAVVILIFLPLLLSCGRSRGRTPPPPQSTFLGTSVVASVVGSKRIDISWSRVSAATRYSVLRSEQTGTAYTFTVTIETTSTLVSDTSVTSGTTYYYIVQAKNSAGEEGPVSAEVAVTPDESPSGTITIQGTITYEDKEYDHTGQTGNTLFQAVRYADVELVGSSLRTTTTSTGFYSFISSANTGSNVYVRVLASSTPVGSHKVNVMNLNGAIYAVKAANFTIAGNANVNITIPVLNQAAGVFNILDVFNSGFEFVHSLGGTAAQTLTASWAPVNPYGTYYCDTYHSAYCRNGTGIYILSDPHGRYGDPDTDEFDDDVLWHEFGHFIADKFSEDHSPGGIHYLNDNTQDLRLSWSEGWGNFFQGGVKFWLSQTNSALISSTAPLSQYVDTEVEGIHLTLDIAAPESSAYCDDDYDDNGIQDDCKYATNEISNANILWNVMTQLVNGMQKIWDVIASYKTPVPAYPASLEVFWDRWRSLHSATFADEQSTLESVFGNREVFYNEDVYESAGDDVFTGATKTITLPFSESHYLYRADETPDRDIVRFTANSAGQLFTIQTTTANTLKNGADTYLRILNGTGAPTGSYNDNWNNAAYSQSCLNCPKNGDVYNIYGEYVSPAALASKILFTAPAAGDYYVEVSASLNRPPSAGRYGSYSLTITTP